MVNFIVYDKDMNPLLTLSPQQLTDYFKTLPKSKRIEFAIQEDGFEPITVGHYLVLTEPSTPATGLIYDSHRDSKLHDGQVRTVTKEGNISPNGLGLECRASGSPKLVVNADGTFSLICGTGHGRFYGYCRNYNVRLEIEAAWWNSASGQDCSLKLRSRHNENDPCDNRFGGYGFSIDRGGYDSKREPCHNNHDQSTSGSVPKLDTQQYFKVTYSVQDVTGGVKQIATVNGQEVMNRTTVRQAADKSIFDQQSYFWVRQNIDSGSGELRVKSLKVFAI